MLDLAAKLLAAGRPEVLTVLSREIVGLVPHRAAAIAHARLHAGPGPDRR